MENQSIVSVSIENPPLFFVNVVMLSVLLFATHVLLLRSIRRQVYLPLAICLLCIAVIMSQPALAPLEVEWGIVALMLSLPAMLFLPPGFWCYARGLTSENSWRIADESRWHWLLPGLGAGVAVFALLMPADLKYQLLVLGDDKAVETLPGLLAYVVKGVLVLTFCLVLGWILQSGFYFVKTIRLLNRYRMRLKDIFASTENREIHWLTWLLIAVGLVWLGTAIDLVVDNLFFDTQPDLIWVNLVVLLMVWSLSVWGVRQKPGFEVIYDAPRLQASTKNTSEENVSDENNDKNQTSILQPEGEQSFRQGQSRKTTSENNKYQRSALSEQQSSRIASKIIQAMEDDKLYLDSSISLQKLAKHTATSSNYISQTLNETLTLKFFDFVNHYRVEAAKELLRDTDDTILAIAMNVGFNAKSSFYTAFKKETQQTPSAWRKENHR